MWILKRQVQEKKSKQPERTSASAFWCQDFRDLERLASSLSSQTGLLQRLHSTSFYKISVLGNARREIEPWGFKRL